jgi:hypothetical protein
MSFHFFAAVEMAAMETDLRPTIEKRTTVDERTTRCHDCDREVDTTARRRIEYADVVGAAILAELPSDAEFCSWQCVYSAGCALIPSRRVDLRAALSARIARLSGD